MLKPQLALVLVSMCILFMTFSNFVNDLRETAELRQTTCKDVGRNGPCESLLEASGPATRF